MDEHRVKLSKGKAALSNRAIRRQYGQVAEGRTFGRFPSGVATGTTQHFKLWMLELKVKSAWQRTSLAEYADSKDIDVQASTGYALAYGAGIKTLWSLKAVSKATLLAIPNLGPSRLKAMRDALPRGLQVNW